MPFGVGLSCDCCEPVECDVCTDMDGPDLMLQGEATGIADGTIPSCDGDCTNAEGVFSMSYGGTGGTPPSVEALQGWGYDVEDSVESLCTWVGAIACSTAPFGVVFTVGVQWLLIDGEKLGMYCQVNDNASIPSGSTQAQFKFIEESARKTMCEGFSETFDDWDVVNQEPIFAGCNLPSSIIISQV